MTEATPVLLPSRRSMRSWNEPASSGLAPARPARRWLRGLVYVSKHRLLRADRRAQAAHTVLTFPDTYAGDRRILEPSICGYTYEPSPALGALRA